MKKSKIDLKFEKMDRKTANSMLGTGAPKRKSSTRKVKKVRKK